MAGRSDALCNILPSAKLQSYLRSLSTRRSRGSGLVYKIHKTPVLDPKTTGNLISAYKRRVSVYEEPFLLSD